MTTQDAPARWSTRLTIHRAAVACAVILAAGCQTTTTERAAPAPPPPVQLLDAARVELPTDCTVPAGQPYRLSYVVGVDGRPGNPDAISPPDAPACLQEALRTWVATFRYAPVTEAERLTADWMLVSARRGS